MKQRLKPNPTYYVYIPRSLSTRRRCPSGLLQTFLRSVTLARVLRALFAGLGAGTEILK